MIAPSAAAAGRAFARFPSIDFISHAEFENFRHTEGATLDALYFHERRLATAEPVLVRPGTCGPCLRPATFTSAVAGGEVLADGRMVPDWREQFACDCDSRLSARLRAVLHFIESVVGTSPWTLPLLFGQPTALDRRLRAMMPRLTTLSRLAVVNGGFRLDAPDASAHLVLALDVLHTVPPLDALLIEIRRVLGDGGQLVFTVPFRALSPSTRSHLDALPRFGGLLPPECGHEVHEIGWDVLARLRAAGFRRSTAHLYRSEELGYLGPLSMIFAAQA